MKQETMGWQWHQLDHYANHWHLAADRQPCQHLISYFYRPDALPDAQPTVSNHSYRIHNKSSSYALLVVLMIHGFQHGSVQVY